MWCLDSLYLGKLVHGCFIQDRYFMKSQNCRRRGWEMWIALGFILNTQSLAYFSWVTDVLEVLSLAIWAIFLLSCARKIPRREHAPLVSCIWISFIFRCSTTIEKNHCQFLSFNLFSRDCCSGYKLNHFVSDSRDKKFQNVQHRCLHHLRKSQQYINKSELLLFLSLIWRQGWKFNTVAVVWNFFEKQILCTWKPKKTLVECWFLKIWS